MVKSVRSPIKKLTIFFFYFKRFNFVNTGDVAINMNSVCVTIHEQKLNKS